MNQPMRIDLAGKVACVSGASKGIGRAVSIALSAAGATVFGSARSPFEAEGVIPVLADMATPEGPGRLVHAALAGSGRIDMLVNSVGGLAKPRSGGFLSVSDEEWQETLDLNLFSAVRLSRAAIPHLLQQQGTIVNISTVGAIKPEPGIIDYAAAKAALNALTKAMSEEYGPQGMRVNSVTVGPVLTEGWTDPGRLGDQLAEALGVDRNTAMDQMVSGLGGLSLPRWGQASEVARAVLFLASELGSFCNGADLRVDGGLYKGV